ncbi:hypothetical protein FOZ62_016524, partial [Perkinsus olseni]
MNSPDTRFALLAPHFLSTRVAFYFYNPSNETVHSRRGDVIFSGRCGRDGRPAISVLMASPFDICRQSVMVYWKPNALQELYALAEYAFSTAQCRRAYLAAHMGDHQRPVCDGYCDVCGVEDSAPPSKRLKEAPDEERVIEETFDQLEKAA